MMEYQKIINLLDNTPNQPSKFRTKNWVELTDELRNIIKSCAQFTNCIREINNTQIDNAKDIDIVMSMYNLIEIVIIILKNLGIWDFMALLMRCTIFRC